MIDAVPVPTFFIVDVHPYTAGDGTVQRASLVVVFGCQALLQPVIQVDAPGSAALPQLVEAAEAPQGHAHGEGFALLVKAHFPVLLASVDHGVSCPDTQAQAINYAELQQQHKLLRLLKVWKCFRVCKLRMVITSFQCWIKSLYFFRTLMFIWKIWKGWIQTKCSEWSGSVSDHARWCFWSLRRSLCGSERLPRTV